MNFIAAGPGPTAPVTAWRGILSFCDCAAFRPVTDAPVASPASRASGLLLHMTVPRRVAAVNRSWHCWQVQELKGFCLAE